MLPKGSWTPLMCAARQGARDAAAALAEAGADLNAIDPDGSTREVPGGARGAAIEAFFRDRSPTPSPAPAFAP